jgi:lipopolysaccharide exporter
MSSWSAETRAGIVWSGSAFLAGKALTFLATLVLARLLTPSEFGVVAAIIVYLTLIELVSDLGMQATVVYEQEEGITERVHVAFTINLALVCLLTAVAVALAPLAADFFDVSGETWLFRLGALNLLLVGLGNIPDGLLLRGMEFRRRSVPLVARSLVSGTVSIALAVAGLGPEALVFGLLAGSAVWTVCIWVMTAFRPRVSFDQEIARSMASYGLGATALDAVAIVGSRVDQAAIGPVLGTRALGLYTVGQRLPEVLIGSLSAVVSHVAFPALSRQRMRDRDGLADATLALLRYQALYALPIAALLAVLATPMIVVLFSSVWAPAAGVMAAISVKAAIRSVGHPLGDAFKAVGRQRVLVFLNACELPLLIALIVIAAPNGIVLVAWVVGSIELLHLTLVSLMSPTVIGVRPRGIVRAIGPAVSAGLGVAAGAGLVRLAWPDASILPLLAGIAAGAAGGVLALMATAPAQLRSLRNHLRELAPRRAAAEA